MLRTITRGTFSPHNHTLFPKRWKAMVPLLRTPSPRHMQIIYAINANTLIFARKGKEV